MYIGYIGEGNGNALQYSCLENSMDRGAWWAAVHGVTESDKTELLTLLLYRFYTSIVLSYIKGLNVKDLGILGDSRTNLFMGTEGQLCSEVPYITKREVS